MLQSRVVGEESALNHDIEEWRHGNVKSWRRSFGTLETRRIAGITEFPRERYNTLDGSRAAELIISPYWWVRGESVLLRRSMVIGLIRPSGIICACVSCLDRKVV